MVSNANETYRSIQKIKKENKVIIDRENIKRQRGDQDRRMIEQQEIQKEDKLTREKYKDTKSFSLQQDGNIRPAPAFPISIPKPFLPSGRSGAWRPGIPEHMIK